MDEKQKYCIPEEPIINESEFKAEGKLQYDLLQKNQFISVHYTTIFRALEHAGMSRKKLKWIAIERNEDRRADFIERMAQYLPEELGFLDETSKDAWTIRRSSGWSEKGKRAEKKQVYLRGRRTSTEALLTLDGMVSGMVVEGSTTKVTFLHYLEFIVVSFHQFYVLYTSEYYFIDAFVFCISWATQCARHG